MVSVLLVTLNSWGQGFAANAPNVKLETPYFYFDNPDGTIEIYPEYGIKGLENRIMSISSSKYANPLKNVPESDIERMDHVVLRSQDAHHGIRLRWTRVGQGRYDDIIRLYRHHNGLLGCVVGRNARQSVVGP